MGLAVLVVDMIGDFVTGKFGSERATSIIPAIKELLTIARLNSIPIFYLQDAHEQNDMELQVWGQHAMNNTESSTIVAELAPEPEDIVIKKHVYSGFFDSELEAKLKKQDVDTIIVTGVSTDICVQHNVADAFFRGLKTYVLTDGTAAIDSDTHNAALKYMAKIYGSNLIDTEAAKSIIKSEG